MLRRTSAGSLFPYLQLRTRRDDRVRDEHARIDGLTASPDWPGWKLYTPPLGWNCRCWLYKVNWKIARELGYSGQIAVWPSGLAA